MAVDRPGDVETAGVTSTRRGSSLVRTFVSLMQPQGGYMKKLISLCALFALSTVMAMAADVTGTWKGEPGAKGPAPSFTFKQDGSALTGKSAGRNGDTDIANG